jgi:hypothetical protein
MRASVSIAAVILVLLITVSTGGTVVIEYDRIAPPVVVRLYPEKPTEITFPEVIVDVITGMGENDASLEKSRDARRFYIMALKKDLDAQVYFLGASGQSYAIVFRTVRKEKDSDATVVITDRRVTKDGEKVRKRKLFFTPALLIRAMILGEKPAGITGINDTDEVLLDLPDIGFTIKAIKKYETALMIGYVVNIIYSGKDFDIRKLQHPRLIAGTVYKGKGYLVFYK